MVLTLEDTIKVQLQVIKNNEEIIKKLSLENETLKDNNKALTLALLGVDDDNI